MLIFRSGKPQYLVSQPSSFLTCSMEKSALRSTSQLFIVLCLSRHVSLFPSHIFHLFYSLTLMHSHLSFFVLRLTSVLFLPLTHLVFNCFSHLFFLISFTSCLHPPPRSSYSLPLAGLCPTNIVPLHLQLCLNWTEHICLRRSFKKGEKKKKKDKVQYSGVPAPEGPSQTRQQARRAFALQPIVLDPVGGEVCEESRVAMQPKAGAFKKDGQIWLVLPVWGWPNRVSLKKAPQTTFRSSR